jgi:hypothetical protein
MPNFLNILRMKTYTAFLGIASGAGVGVFQSFSAYLGNFITANPLEATVDGLLRNAMTRCLLGGMVNGLVTIPVFVGANDDWFFRYEFTKRLYPVVPVLLPLLTEIIGDGILSAAGINCSKYDSTICVSHDNSFVSRPGFVGIVGTGVISGAVLVVLAGYKIGQYACRASRDDAINEGEPYLALAEDKAEGNEVTNYRERLAACYEGEIPPEYKDAKTDLVMNMPVMLQCGDNFDLASLPQLLADCDNCPVCLQKFNLNNFISPPKNKQLRDEIISFVEEKERFAHESRAYAQIIDIHDDERAEGVEVNGVESIQPQAVASLTAGSHGLFAHASGPPAEDQKTPIKRFNPV